MRYRAAPVGIKYCITIEIKMVIILVLTKSFSFIFSLILLSSISICKLILRTKLAKVRSQRICIYIYIYREGITSNSSRVTFYFYHLLFFNLMIKINCYSISEDDIYILTHIVYVPVSCTMKYNV